MVDASVGGKTGVNTKFGKNLVGCFHQPKLVFAAMDSISTLNDAEFRCGLGEVIKHSVLDDDMHCLDGMSHLDWLLKHGKDIASRSNLDLLMKAIKRSCEVKAKIVARDELESGQRALLNLGHTVAHAIEFCQGISTKSDDKLRHGEAVAIGTLVETKLSMKRGTLEQPELVQKLELVIKDCGLPTTVEGLDVDELVKATSMDKKREKDVIKVTQPIREGKVILEKLKPEELRHAFESL